MPIPSGWFTAAWKMHLFCVSPLSIFQSVPTATHGAPPSPCTAGVHTDARHQGSDRCANCYPHLIFHFGSHVGESTLARRRGCPWDMEAHRAACPYQPAFSLRCQHILYSTTCVTVDFCNYAYKATITCMGWSALDLDSFFNYYLVQTCIWHAHGHVCNFLPGQLDYTDGVTVTAASCILHACSIEDHTF